MKIERGKIMKNALMNMNMKIRGLLKRQEGQGMVEYALIVSGIAAVVIILVVIFKDKLTEIVEGIFPATT